MSDWENKDPISLRSRLAIGLILLAIQLLDPYKFKHEFQDDFNDLKEALTGKVKGKP
jgi:hypothetical protein